ncbi:MAG: hypothetical protein ABRQ25_16870 [Clostridiaceae bacterium]
MTDLDGQFTFLAVLFAPAVSELVAAVITVAIIYAPVIINEMNIILSTYGPQITSTAQKVAEKTSGNNSSSGGNNNKDKGSGKPAYKNYDAKQIEKKYGLKKGEFHQIKKDILVEAKKAFPKEMKRVGDNLDIHLNQDGLMKVVSRTSNASFELKWDIQSFIH